MNDGMPMEDIKPRPKFHEEMRQARNAEEALLAVLNACARVTKTISEIKWPSRDAFGAWIARLQGQRTGSENVLALECLSFLDLQHSILFSRDLEGANLYRANLSGAYLSGANLSVANLSGANLDRAELSVANLYRANLSGANLSDANLDRANLIDANLIGANLIGANLDRTNLDRANLINAENLTPEQVKQAQNWEKAKYDEEFRALLGLPPEPAN